MLAKRSFESGAKQLPFKGMRANVFVVKCGRVHKTADHQPGSHKAIALGASLLHKFFNRLLRRASHNARQFLGYRRAFLLTKLQHRMARLLRFRNIRIGK